MRLLVRARGAAAGGGGAEQPALESSAEKATDNVTRDSGPVRAAESTGDDADAGKRAGSARGWNPCRLVTRAEARGIVGKAVATELGKQGPTCIYSSRSPRQSLTLALQPASVDELTRGQRGLIDVPLRGRKAVCVSAGGPKLLVPLAGGGVLERRRLVRAGDAVRAQGARPPARLRRAARDSCPDRARTARVRAVVLSMPPASPSPARSHLADRAC